MSNNNNIKKEGYKMDNPINCYGQFREKLHKKLFLFCEFEEHEIESIYEDVSKVGLEWEFIYSYCKLFFVGILGLNSFWNRIREYSKGSLTIIPKHLEDFPKNQEEIIQIKECKDSIHRVIYCISLNNS